MKKKYSIKADMETATLLMLRGIPFVSTYGKRKHNQLLFFMADDEDVEWLSKNTRFSVLDEELNWDFNHWDALDCRY